MADDILASEITSAGVQIGLAQNQGKYYYLKDALGSVTDVVDGFGNIIQRYNYSSFGKIDSIKNGNGVDITSSPIVNTSFTYTGRELDIDAGLYYFRARYYDPSIGRFIQADPDPGKISNPITMNNKYVYANNLPTLLRDPTGKIAFLIPMIIGAIVGGIMGVLENQQNGGNWLSQVFQGMIGGALFGAAIAINTGAGLTGLAISGAKAGAEGGNFLHNFNAHIVGDGFKTAFGAGLVADIDGLNSIPYLGSLFTPLQMVVDIITPPLLIYTAVDLYNTECDKTKHGLYETNPGMCHAF